MIISTSYFVFIDKYYILYFELSTGQSFSELPKNAQESVIAGFDALLYDDAVSRELAASINQDTQIVKDIYQREGELPQAFKHVEAQRVVEPDPLVEGLFADEETREERIAATEAIRPAPIKKPYSNLTIILTEAKKIEEKHGTKS